MLKSSVQKSSDFFYCESCDYTTCRYSQYIRHTTTLKHIKSTKSTSYQQLSTKKSSESFECDCGKTYKERSGLWRHKQKCNIENKQILNDTIENGNFMHYLIKENSEFKELLQEQNKIIMKMCESNVTQTIYNNSNNNNKTFNLQLFLNETCKDAMNITDFIHSLKIQLTDLENVGEVGFVNGITNIIVQNLKSLDITQRPVHCTDAKREVLYIKDENKWEKEGEENIKLRKAIKHVAFKNTKMLPEFRKKYPDCGKSESKYADQYNKLIIEAMGGKGENDKEKEDKIIKNIAKEVIIEK
jgi:hypothetical protein